MMYSLKGLSKVSFVDISATTNDKSVQVVGYCRGCEGLQSDIRIAANVH